MAELSFEVFVDSDHLAMLVTENLNDEQILNIISQVEGRVGTCWFSEELLKRAILCCKRHYSHDPESFRDLCNELIEEV